MHSLNPISWLRKNRDIHLNNTGGTNFLSLPRKARDRVYELVMLTPGSEFINPWVHKDLTRKHTLGLLRVNKTISREASSILYCNARFDFSNFYCGTIACFLEQIGQSNAENIKDVCLHYPELDYLKGAGDITIKDDDLDILEILQDYSPEIRRLWTRMKPEVEMEMDCWALDKPKVVAQALKLIDTHFRALDQLQEIHVEVHEYVTSEDIRREMEALGWSLETQAPESWTWLGVFAALGFCVWFMAVTVVVVKTVMTWIMRAVFVIWSLFFVCGWLERVVYR